MIRNKEGKPETVYLLMRKRNRHWKPVKAKLFANNEVKYKGRKYNYNQDAQDYWEPLMTRLGLQRNYYPLLVVDEEISNPINFNILETQEGPMRLQRIKWSFENSHYNAQNRDIELVKTLVTEQRKQDPRDEMKWIGIGLIVAVAILGIIFLVIANSMGLLDAGGLLQQIQGR